MGREARCRAQAVALAVGVALQPALSLAQAPVSAGEGRTLLEVPELASSSGPALWSVNNSDLPAANASVNGAGEERE